MRTSTAADRPRIHSSLPASTLAIVLAGGNGTRLQQLTRFECKPALPFAGRFRNIDFSLSNCLHSGIRRIAVLTQYKSQSLIRHLQAAWSFLPRALGEFVELWPAQQRDERQWYSGTANAVHQNFDLIRGEAPRLVLVLAGDHVYKMDYRALLRQHVHSGAEVTVCCVPVPAEEAGGFGVLTTTADGRIASFIEKPSRERLGTIADGHVLGSMGIYVFNADYLEELLAHDARIGDSSHDFGRDLIPAAVAAGDANAFVFTDASGQPGYWRDVGTLQTYWQAHMELLDPATAFTLFDPAWPIFTGARQLPPTQLLASARACSIDNSMVAEGCLLDSVTLAGSVIGPAVRIGVHALLERTVVLPDASIGARCRLRGVIVEAGCHVPADTVIGEDAIADGARFTSGSGGVILVTAEALRRLPPPAEAWAAVG